MKNRIIILLAASLFTATVPALAMASNSMESKQHDEQCQKDCDMMMKDCTLEVDSIQQRIQKLEAAVEKYGAQYNKEQLGKVKNELEDQKLMLYNMERGGA